MRTVSRRGVVLLAMLVACLGSGRALAAVGCAEFELWVTSEGGGFYYASLCDGEPVTCTVLDYVGMDVYPAYDPNALPRICSTTGTAQCEHVVGSGGALRNPRTENIAQANAACGIQQVIYYQCGKRCYCYTVCAAAVPATSAAPTAPNASRIDPSRSPHVSRNIRLKAPMEESYVPRKNQKSPFAENINISFPAYFSFASMRRPGTIIHAKGFIVTTQKFQWNSKTYPGLTVTNGYEVKKGSETYPLISADNVKLAGNTTSSYVVKVSGVDYLIHTAE